MAIVGSRQVLKQLTFGHASAALAASALDPGLTEDARVVNWNPRLVRRLQAYAMGEEEDLRDVPVDPGPQTRFQRRVTACCRSIPRGSTLTYGQLAAKAGSPGAARAVGNCMAANRIPLVIPCHRVVGAGGRLHGYSGPGGQTMKRLLLDLEQGKGVRTVFHEVGSRPGDGSAQSTKSPAAFSRREFLGGVGRAALGVLAIGSGLAPAGAASDDAPSSPPVEPAETTQLSPHLAVYRGPINVGIVHDGQKALLIDCGDGSVAAALGPLGIAAVDRVLFTHHHRDQACGAHAMAARGVRILVPAAERKHFDDVASYWKNPASRWHIYNQHPHHLMLAEPVRVDGVLKPDQEIVWGPARIRVLATPGHTDGSISFLVEVDGRRVVFCGDAIYDEGRIWELYSLQKGTTTSDYHGFLGARPQLVESLGRIQAAKPDVLVPSHGRIMRDPPKAASALVRRLDACYDKYVAISALRHYFPKMFQEYAGRPGHMPIRPGKPVPDCLRHFGTTWMLVSKDKAAFVMDCGGADVIKRIQSLAAKGEIRSVEALWVTHYHDDHVDAIPAFQETFDCPCITDRHVAEVITDPMAWRLPCISPSKARVDRATKDGDSWQWHEFRLTAYHLPGQTLYHSGLFVESGGLRMFFVGDSFTMAGIDDYCAQNRCWLGPGVGFDRCIELVEKLRPTHLFNCHVDLAFDFTPEECRLMRANLAERVALYGQLFPWDHPNYGMDEAWVRCHPYEQRAEPGADVKFSVVVTNHSAESRKAVCRAVLPRGWGGGTTGWSSAEMPPKQDGQIGLSLRVPAGARNGRYIIPVDLHYDGRILPQFTEAIVAV
jgi:O-6-methylguanine DNA methyltransferase